MSTSTLFEYRVKPRTLIAHALASICSTSTPGPSAQVRTLVAPERRISSGWITQTAAAVRRGSALRLEPSDFDVHQVFHVHVAQIGLRWALAGRGGDEEEADGEPQSDCFGAHSLHIGAGGRFV